MGAHNRVEEFHNLMLSILAVVQCITFVKAQHDCVDELSVRIDCVQQ
jgi:hypothetical protein